MPIVDTDDLETKCYKCGGSGWITITDIPARTDEYREQCDKCGGKGTLLTAMGKILMNIIRKHL